MIFKRFILWFLIFASCGLTAQDNRVNLRHFSIEEGLSARFALSFYHDSRGFVWIGTNYGLNRYDGHEFRIYTKGKDGLEDDYIKSIHEDVDGNIWAVSANGAYSKGAYFWDKTKITILNPDKNGLISFESYFRNACPFIANDIINIFQDEERVLWITILGGKFFKYDGAFTQIYDSTLPGEKMRFIPDAKDGFWKLYNNELTGYDKAGEIISKDHQSGINVNLQTIPEGGLWMSQLKGKYDSYDKNCSLYYKKKGDEIKPFTIAEELDRPQEKDNNNAYIIDKIDLVWYFSAANKVLNILNKKGELIQDLSSLLKNKNAPDMIVRDLFFDRDNNAWLLTNDGVYQIISYKDRFERFLSQEGFSIRGMTEIDSSTIFVHTYKGVKILNFETGILKDITFLNAHYGLGLIKPENENIWSGTYVPRVYKYDIKTGEHKTYFNSDRLPRSTNSFHYNDTFQKVYVGTSIGLMVVDIAKDSLFEFTQYNEFEKLKDIFIHSFYKNEEGIWVMTQQGIFLLDARKGIIGEFHDFPYNDIVNMHQDQNGIYWLATMGGGLIKWNFAKKEIEQFTTDEGLSHDVIYAVYEDDRGFLWLPSNNGLMLFNKTTKQVITYFTEDGLGHNEFNRHAHCKMKDGRFVFGGLNGLVVFDPLKINSPDFSENGKMQIIDLKMLDGNSGELIDQTEALISSHKIQMEPENKSFILKFALLNISRTSTQSYVYQIDGLEKEWNHLQGNVLRINQLPYGNYTLKIRGEGTIGDDTANELSIPIEVVIPFTATPIFYLLILLGLGLLTWGYFKLRVYQLEKTNLKLEGEVYKRTVEIENDKKIISQQYEQVEELNKTKDRLFAIIAHDLRDYVSSFTGVEKKINYLIDSGQLERIPKLTAYIENAASDLNLLLENLLNWAMQQKEGIPYHPDKLKLKKLSTEAIQSLYKFADEKEISIIVDIPKELTAYADNRALATIIRNLVHNAIKFSPRGGTVQIKTIGQAEKTQLLIQDSGVGIAKEMIPELFTFNGKRSTSGTENEKGTGLGLMLCKELVEIQNGAIKVSSQKGKGTSFTITLPSFQTV